MPRAPRAWDPKQRHHLTQENLVNTHRIPMRKYLRMQCDMIITTLDAEILHEYLGSADDVEFRDLLQKVELLRDALQESPK